jgi:MFS family permease
VFQYLGWRWTNWIVVIVSGVAFISIILIPETYAPAILRARAAKRRKETDDDRYWSRYDDKQAFLPLLKVNLSRPFIMTFTEPILIFWDLYIALVYGILYLCFVAYPIIFTELRGWSPGISGLAFVGIGVGSLIVIAAEPLIRKMINAHKPDPETGRPPPEAGVSIICIGAVLLPIGQIWFSWTGTPEHHWILPILAGIPFGAGNCSIFIYGSNYLVHSYGIYAASALAGNAVLRSVLGATLPLAGPSLYASLGPHWAGTLLGLLEAVCIPIPIIFYVYGYRIRQKSALIRTMQEDKTKFENKRARAAERSMARTEAEAEAGAGMETGAAVAEEVVEEKSLGMDLEKGVTERTTR